MSEQSPTEVGSRRRRREEERARALAAQQAAAQAEPHRPVAPEDGAPQTAAPVPAAARPLSRRELRERALAQAAAEAERVSGAPTTQAPERAVAPEQARPAAAAPAPAQARPAPTAPAPEQARPDAAAQAPEQGRSAAPVAAPQGAAEAPRADRPLSRRALRAAATGPTGVGDHRVPQVQPPAATGGIRRVSPAGGLTEVEPAGHPVHRDSPAGRRVPAAPDTAPQVVAGAARDGEDRPDPAVVFSPQARAAAVRAQAARAQAEREEQARVNAERAQAQRLAAQRSEADRSDEERAADQRAALARLADQRSAEVAAAQALVEERRAAERAAAEQRAAEQRAAEHRALQQRAAEQRAALERAAGQREALERAAEQRGAQARAAQQRAEQPQGAGEQPEVPGPRAPHQEQRSGEEASPAPHVRSVETVPATSRADDGAANRGGLPPSGMIAVVPAGRVPRVGETFGSVSLPAGARGAAGERPSLQGFTTTAPSPEARVPQAEPSPVPVPRWPDVAPAPTAWTPTPVARAEGTAEEVAAEGDTAIEDVPVHARPYTWLHILVLVLVAFVLGMLIFMVVMQDAPDPGATGAALDLTHQVVVGTAASPGT